MTLDLGAGPMEILSNSAILYGHWHELIIDRRSYYITVIVRSEEGQVHDDHYVHACQMYKPCCTLTYMLVILTML